MQWPKNTLMQQEKKPTIPDQSNQSTESLSVT